MRGRDEDGLRETVAVCGRCGEPYPSTEWDRHGDGCPMCEAFLAACPWPVQDDPGEDVTR